MSMNLLLPVLVVLSLLPASMALFYARRCWLQTRRLETELRNSNERLEKSIKMMLFMQKCLRSLQQQTVEAGRKLRQTSSRQQELETRDFNNVAYLHASKLVRMGADSEELINNCGLSPAEARLLAMMHEGQKGRA
ncbi:MAG: DUF2802 domain-containing protein [Pseudomonadales bacterium]|nr:DUF2802 domain-containing protein [Pseudomonadales bacterium]